MSLRDPSPTFHLHAPMTLESRGLAGESIVRFAYRHSLRGQNLQRQPSLRTRWTTRWQGTDSGPERLTDSTIYIPTVSNEVPFDAFFINYDSADSAVLWLIRMTVYPTCGGSAQGFQDVAKLREKIERERNRPVPVKFLLVVPHAAIETSEVGGSVSHSGRGVCAVSGYMTHLGGWRSGINDRQDYLVFHVVGN